MERDQLIQKLTATFLVELRDHVRNVERDLLALERGGDAKAQAELYSSLFRTAHSLKGASRAVGAGLVETACHRLEEIVQAFRDGVLAPDKEVIQLFLATADAIGEAGERIGARQDLSGSALAALLPRLSSATDREPPAKRTSASPPKPIPLPEPPPVPELPPVPVPRPSGAHVVRLPAAKLDALLAQNEQLLVARRRSDAHDDMAANLQDIVRTWQQNWAEMDRHVARAFAGARPSEGGHEGELRQATQILSRHRGDLRRFDRAMQKFVSQTAADRRQIDQTAAELGGEIRHVRMLPFADACEGLDRVVRDLTAGSGKRARLTVIGSDTAIDRSLLEGLRDPLIQMVRNAVHHGIEPETARREAGKPPDGQITITATLRGTQIVVTVADDGKGIDTAAVAAEAQRRNLDGNGANPLDAIFHPGFSTTASVTTVSGRGFGLDIVKTKVEAMRGSVEVASETGRFTRFKLTLPLTLTTIRALLVRAGGQVFALDSMFIAKLLRVAPGDVRVVEGRSMVVGGKAPVALASLASLLGLPETPHRGDGRKLAVIVLAVGEREAAISVDELLGEQELLVRSLSARLKHLENVAGGTVLPSGRIALILHSGDLMRGVLAGAPRSAAPKPTERSKPRRRLVIADDSMTTRTLMKTILEGAGYDVFAAADGSDAWHLLQDSGADLVVTDVEMPIMDGFALTETIRNSARFHDLPVVLMTALETDEDKARGLRAGATAYLTKSTFDQRDLLATIQQIL
jgi:two-component system chemotaxis sensor kinase CheA